MPWSFSFQLLHGETLVEDSSQRETALVKPVYSVFLTDRRVVFRFGGFGSNLCKSFFYHEISDIQPTTRLLVSYLKVRAGAKDELFNVHEADYLAGRIRELRGKYVLETETFPATRDKKHADPRRQELFDMLLALRDNGLLSEEEFYQKVEQLDSLPL